MSDRYEQQSRIIDRHEMALPVTIIGAGAIGSFFALIWAKMGGGKDITLVDPDTIEVHNIPNQMYPEASIGKKKVDACRAMIEQFTGDESFVTVKDTRLEDEYKGDAYGMRTGLLVSSVDNMDVRKEIWERAKAGKVKYFIDGRMGAQVMRVYAVDMGVEEDRAAFEKTLYPQSEAAPDRCAEKTIIYTVAVVAGLMVNAGKRLLKGERLPFSIEYDCVNNMQFTEYPSRHAPKKTVIEEEVEVAS